MLAHGRIGGNGPEAHNDGDRLRSGEFTADPCRQGGIVSENGARADQDGIGCGTPAVHVGSGVRSRDPRARAVICRGAAVQALCPLDGDERPPESHDGQPRLQHVADLVGPHAGLDLDAVRAQTLGPSCGGLRGVGDRVHDTRHAGLDERERTRPGSAGVIAGLEGDDHRRAAGFFGGEARECLDLGVRIAGAAMPPLCQHSTARAQHDRPHLRVHTAWTLKRELTGAAHGLPLRIAVRHPRSLRQSGALRRIAHRDPL